MSKNLYIISGCNGAGKTTASYTVLPEVLHCKEFVNADEIARGLSPFNSESVAIEAGRLMLQRIEDLLAKEESRLLLLLSRTLILYVEHRQRAILSDCFSFGLILQSWHCNELLKEWLKEDIISLSLS